MKKLKKAFSLCKNGRFDLLLYEVSRTLGFKNILPPLPFSLWIEPTNACNLQCPTCPTGSGRMKRPKRMMTLAEFQGIIDQAKGYAKAVMPYVYGEPFLNKELLSMIKYATAAGMHVSISTNGEFFKSRDFCFQVVQSGLKHLIICLDGADQETIGKFRRGCTFSDILQGFQFIREAKTALDSQTPKVELQFIIMKHNEHQRTYIKELAERLEVDAYCEKTVGIGYDDPEFQNLAAEFLPEDLSIGRYYLREDGTFMIKGETLNMCSFVESATVIHSDGTVVPCCYDPDSHYAMGNVFEESLKKIWKNRKYRAFRNQIKRNRKSIPICNTCPEARQTISKSTDLK